MYNFTNNGELAMFCATLRGDCCLTAHGRFFVVESAEFPDYDYRMRELNIVSVE